ncbi:MAG TPA: HoxN/HupN/NixA family nickel/cobalt transporter [Candidatus Sulfotelmatobacter sp.]|nr:HoxN/HupN/NixA family nickel/cobalt transporter [Candidatus Sulfotelmatobacter sp.]
MIEIFRRFGLDRKVGLLFAGLIAANAASWLWALVAFRDYPVLLGTALLAYSFGLRHAVDADHIAAIDNVTRKLIQMKRRPASVGFFFSLGHSSIVVLASLLVAGTALAFKNDIEEVHGIGGVIGTSVSAAFLLVIAAVNLIILKGVWQVFARVRRGESYVEEDLNALLAGRGVLARLFRSLFRLISKSWHMYPLGFLFGLGFDTATEVGLLGISAAEAAKGMSLWSILVFPALFTSGMALVDTLDSTLMTGAYGWAFVKPVRKIYYNLTLTIVSVAVALLVGGVEALGLLADQFALSGPFWDGIGALNDSFGLLGYLIVGLFIAAWAVSAAIYRLKGYDALEVEAS